MRLLARRLALTLLLALPVAPVVAAQTESSPDAAVTALEESAEYESVDVLKARVRPLTLAEAEEELAVWLLALEEKAKEVADVEIAGFESEDAKAIHSFNEQAVALRTERGRLVKRVNVILDQIEAKGGDVTEAKAYVGSVHETPPVTGWTAALATVRAWLVNPDGGVAMAKALGGAALILLGAWLASLILGRVTARLLLRSKRMSVLLRTFVVTAVKRSVIALGLLMAVSKLGVNMGPMLAAIGAAGLVIGLALQGTLSNFASGLMIMVYRPFDVGDVVTTAGVTGKVEGMTLVTTSICTLDNKAISVPNNTVWGDVITNVTAKKVRRIDMLFGISYGDDVIEARTVLMDILKSHDQVLADPEPNVQVHELGDSSVNFVVRPWVKTDDYWNVYWDITTAVKRRFDEEDISIPFPQRDVHLFPQAPLMAAGEAEANVVQPAARPAEAPQGEPRA